MRSEKRRLEGRLEGEIVISSVRNEDKEGNNLRMGEIYISIDNIVISYENY